MVPYSEILEENDGNMNVPRYIQKIDDSLPQNIAAHLRGGIPKHDIDSLIKLWEVSPELKKTIFTCVDPVHDIYELALPSEEIEAVFDRDPMLQAEKRKEGVKVFKQWREDVRDLLLGITEETVPKEFVRQLGSMILEAYKDSRFLDAYDIYDCLMNYWNEKLQDDVYAIRAYGYEAGRDIEYDYAQKKVKDASGVMIQVDDKSKVKSFEGSLIPRAILEQEYFAEQLAAITALNDQREQLSAEMDEMREEESGEEGLLREVLTEDGDLPKAKLQERIKKLSNSTDSEEYQALQAYKKKLEQYDALGKGIKNTQKELDEFVQARYATLTVEEIKHLLFDRKWMPRLSGDINGEIDRILNQYASRVIMIAKRYEHTLGEIEEKTAKSREAVRQALERMGYRW